MFYLDECLAYQISDALSSVGHPIESARSTKMMGTKDEDLIPWLAARGYIWITLDDAAKREHDVLIRRHQLSVIWVRGADRKRKGLTIKQIHLILTVELPRIEEELRSARGPRYYMVYLADGSRPTRSRTTLEDVFTQRKRQGRSHR